jgi:hypothetical protein
MGVWGLGDRGSMRSKRARRFNVIQGAWGLGLRSISGHNNGLTGRCWVGLAKRLMGFRRKVKDKRLGLRPVPYIISRAYVC